MKIALIASFSVYNYSKFHMEKRPVGLSRVCRFLPRQRANEWTENIFLLFLCVKLLEQVVVLYVKLNERVVFDSFGAEFNPRNHSLASSDRLVQYLLA